MEYNSDLVGGGRYSPHLDPVMVSDPLERHLIIGTLKNCWMLEVPLPSVYWWHPALHLVLHILYLHYLIDDTVPARDKYEDGKTASEVQTQKRHKRCC